ncbi:hypothetical protein RSAG8_09806, partial [Rhizoctonia solani AG-8 WAC10335]
MTRLLCTVFFSALLASAATHSTRKSLRFVPRHPAARHITEPRTTSLAPDTDPFDVARVFLQSHIDSDLFIRNDSYTDKNTSVTHVYVRQRVHGLEVADGNINLNIRDGHVMSYGDSVRLFLALYYLGLNYVQVFPRLYPVLRNPVDSSSTSHATYCAQFSQRMPLTSDNSQVVLSEPSGLFYDWFIHHCTRPLAAVQAGIASDSRKDDHNVRDPRRAALYFMISAHPESTVVQDLIDNFDATLDGMTVSHERLPATQVDQPFILISGLPGVLRAVKAREVYVQIPSENQGTQLHPSWRLEVEMQDNWYEAYVSANEPSTVVSVIDWASDSPISRSDGHVNALEAKLNFAQPVKHTKSASYKVFKWGINDPQSGHRTLCSPPYDTLASPLGWHTISRVNKPKNSPDWDNKHKPDHDGDSHLDFMTTWGNNVLALGNGKSLTNPIKYHIPNAGREMKFEYAYNPEANSDDVPDGSSPESYIDFSLTQLFYTSNMVHDLYYRYGFDEVSGNFQQDNYNRGGRDRDAIIAHAQDGDGRNNANFMTPPDGQSGVCRMYVWDTATPFRDGALDAGVLIHELTHGLSARLTGGHADSGCLGTSESAGMGEGWGDFFATTIRSNQDHQYYPMGSWAANKEGGIRNYLYSANMTVNPSTYETLDEPGYWSIHAIGEVWAEILWVVSVHLVKKHGFSTTLFPPQPLEDGTVPIGDFYLPRREGRPYVPKHGNTLMMQLVIFGMKLQPCDASFFNARDAIIEADRHLTGGENFCDLWAAFSSRGLGIDAAVRYDDPWGDGIRTNGFRMPAECR